MKKLILISLLGFVLLLSNGCGLITQVVTVLTTPTVPNSVPPQASNLVDYTLPIAGTVSPTAFNRIVFHFTNSMNTSTFSIANNFTMPVAPICKIFPGSILCPSPIPTYAFYPNRFQWSTTDKTNDTLTLFFSSTPPAGYTYTFDLLPGNNKPYLSNSTNQAYLSAPVEVSYTVEKPTGVLPYVVNVTPGGVPLAFDPNFNSTPISVGSMISPHEPLNFNFSQLMGNISVAVSPSNCCGVINGGLIGGFPTGTNLTVNFLSSDLTDPYVGPVPTMNMYGDPLTTCFPNCSTPGTYSAKFTVGSVSIQSLVASDGSSVGSDNINIPTITTDSPIYLITRGKIEDVSIYENVTPFNSMSLLTSCENCVQKRSYPTSTNNYLTVYLIYPEATQTQVVIGPWYLFLGPSFFNPSDSDYVTYAIKPLTHIGTLYLSYPLLKNAFIGAFSTTPISGLPAVYSNQPYNILGMIPFELPFLGTSENFPCVPVLGCLGGIWITQVAIQIHHMTIYHYYYQGLIGPPYQAIGLAITGSIYGIGKVVNSVEGSTCGLFNRLADIQLNLLFQPKLSDNYPWSINLSTGQYSLNSFPNDRPHFSFTVDTYNSRVSIYNVTDSLPCFPGWVVQQASGAIQSGVNNAVSRINMADLLSQMFRPDTIEGLLQNRLFFHEDNPNPPLISRECYTDSALYGLAVNQVYWTGFWFNPDTVNATSDDTSNEPNNEIDQLNLSYYKCFRLANE